MKKILLFTAVLLLGLVTCSTPNEDASIAVTDVTLNYNTAALAVGETKTKVATVQPQNATNRNVTWTSSNPTVATVNSNGVVTALSAGTTTIIATTQDGGRTAVSNVTVSISVASITLNITATTLLVGESETLTATVLPENATNRNVMWSSNNPNVATVTNGIVTTLSEGIAIITATTEDGTRTATATVTVNTPTVSVTGVTLNRTATTLIVGASETLIATITPTNATNQNVTWHSNNTTIATVDANGRVVAIAPGTATITVTTEDGTQTATATVTVNAPTVSVTNVTLNRTTATLIVGASETLIATVIPTNATNQNVTWRSNNTAVATVDANGRVIAVSPGTATITVTTEDGARIATCVVTVNAPTISVTGVTLNRTTTTLTVGGTETLTATIAPANATNQNVTWTSSNSAVATVNANGVVTAISAGTATITVTTEDGARTATATVTVNNPIISVTGVTLNRTATTLTVGGTETLTATIAPANATNQNVTWTSSNSAVATVNANGVVTAISAGTATITVTTEDGARTANATVTVNAPNVPVTGVTLNHNIIHLGNSETVTLTATVAPANATNQNVMWTSSNISVATVDAYGVVTAHSLGTATITATTQDGAHTASCVVIVVPVSVTGVTLNRTETSIFVGASETLTANIIPAHATNRAVVWHSSNPAVATVNANGVVTAVSVGITTITVTTADGEHTATCTVTVLPIAVTGVTLNRNTTTMFVGGTENLVATVSPANAHNQNVTWSSSNPSVATVDTNGQVTAVSLGTATITVTTEDGARTATCVVTVMPIFVTNVTLRNSATILVGENRTLDATILPANATNQNVTWVSSNPSVASVDATGRVSAISIGTATITVITEDGNRTASTMVYTVTSTFDHGVVIDNIRWARRNVNAPGTFADNPEDVGMFYQWNRRQGWASTGIVIGWNSSIPTGTTWEEANDPCPQGWRVPTEAELTSLRTVSTWVNNYDGTSVNGRIFGTASNQVFLPAGGERISGNSGGGTSFGYYWSNTQSTQTTDAMHLQFSSGGVVVAARPRVRAFSVRCVAIN